MKTKKNHKIIIAVMAAITICATASTVYADEGVCEHQWSAWKVVKEATIREKGLNSRQCSVCGAKESTVTSKLTPTIKLSKTKATIQKKKKLQLSVTFAKGDQVKSWKSSNKRVATVSKKGKVTAKKPGKAKITVTLGSGKKAKCTIKVVKHLHTWKPIYKTVKHPAQYKTEDVYKEEPVYKWTDVCNGCGEIEPSAEHSYQHVLKGENGSTSTINVQVGTKKVKTGEKKVLVKKAWTEKKIVGYKCSCGKKK